MILIRNQAPSTTKSRIVLLFGNGLIGSSIVRHFLYQDDVVMQKVSFDWTNTRQGEQDAKSIFEIVKRQLSQLSEDKNIQTNIAFVWSAGKAGFSATKESTDIELASFRIVLALAEKIYQQFPDNSYSFHLLSSAGGLFENQGMVDNTTVSSPNRPYGQLKYDQEELVLAVDQNVVKYIYRPTSVYGFSSLGQRMGLIPTLIANGYKNQTSTIFGSLSTLRDYVFNEDIGRHITKNLFPAAHNSEVNIQFLATGKPSSIYEIKYSVEYIIRKKIYLKFVTNPETDNSVDITVNSSILPTNWSTTDIRTGIRYVREMIVAK